MIRQTGSSLSLALAALMLFAGCQPHQPFFLGEDGDLSHHVGQQTDIEYPDVNSIPLDDVAHSNAPLTLENANFEETWDLKLEEAVQHALANSKVVRTLGGVQQLGGRFSNLEPNVRILPQALLANSDVATTVYDPARQESSSTIGGLGTGLRGFGPEAALAAFDADVSASVFWSKNDRPQNFGTNPFFVPFIDQHTGTFQAGISKTAAPGSTFFFRNRTAYDQNNGPLRRFISDWTTEFEGGFNQPLLQGGGVGYNRIAGPFNPFTGTGTAQFDGVVLARINTDQAITDFEEAIRDLVMEVEAAYWELYFAYRNLETRKTGLESALATWKRVYSLYISGLEGGDAADEAQAREQFFFFRGQVEAAKSDLFAAENRLRYLIGLAVSDGRLIRPADEPTNAEVAFQWHDVLHEGLVRSVELRRQKWQVKRRELELTASKNHLLPRLDAVGLYRWVGMGDDLIDSSGGKPPLDNAFQTLMSGDFQEWEFGLQMSIKLGFRAELAAVRHAQLNLARDKAVHQEMELELSHQIAETIRDIDINYTLTQTHFNRRVAAQKQVEAIGAKYEAGTETLDTLVDAQRRLADAESAYFRSLVDYNRAIAMLHLRKGSLLEYNSIHLAEGPWPGKAYFDALWYARQRDASIFMDYGYNRPEVFSRGPYLQHGGGHHDGHMEYEEGRIYESDPELVPTPEPEADRAFDPLGGDDAADEQFRSRLERRNLSAGRQPPPAKSRPRLRLVAGETSEDRTQKNYDWGELGLEE